MARVLIVDDDTVMRKLLGKTLRPLDLDIIYCSDGSHALDILRCNSDIAVMIVDIGLPVLNGRELIQIMSRDGRLATIPVLIMSGMVGAGEVADLVDDGVVRFIPKPFHITTVQEEVAHCLRRSASLRS